MNQVLKQRPTLQTQRLILRPFELADAGDVKRLAGDRAIADTTRNIAHPYEDGMAEKWISTHQAKFEAGELANFAIALRTTGELVGAIGLVINRGLNEAELGYWIGVPYWRNGFATEAARAVVAFGFDEFALHRIHAHYLTRNPASERVLIKLGMKLEGIQRQAARKWGVLEDVAQYAILVTDTKRA